MIKKYWEDRYTNLLKDGVNGSMSVDVNDRVIAFQDEIKPFLKGKGTVVAFGCGTGKNMAFLGSVFKAKQVIGVDQVDFLLEDNKKRLPGFEFLLYDGSLPKCDIIFSSFCLQHVSDKEFDDILKVFKTALKKGGYIYIINAVIEGTDNKVMYFRNEKRHMDIFKKAGLKSEVLYKTKVSNSDVALFKVAK